MPRNIIGPSPFKVRTVDTDQPITQAQILAALGNSPRVSLCIRSAEGHAKRGGYFFHIERSGAGFLMCDFERSVVDTLDAGRLVRFVNHVSGRQFDAEMLTYCQSVVNFKQDQSGPETKT